MDLQTFFAKRGQEGRSGSGHEGPVNRAARGNFRSGPGDSRKRCESLSPFRTLRRPAAGKRVAEEQGSMKRVHQVPEESEEYT